MPLPSSTPTKEKKTTTPVGTTTTTACHVGTPTPSLRRGVVKPLGEHNRSRSHSPALGSLSVKDKRTPARAQKTLLTGVDLTRRFTDSLHGPLATSRGPAEFRSPRGSPSLDRIQEGCSSSLGRERKGAGAAFKSRLRGGGDDNNSTPVKKAITFSTPFGKETIGKDSVRKHERAVKRKDLNEHFTLEGKKEEIAIGSLSAKPYLERRTARDVDFFPAREPSKLSLFSDLPISKGTGLRGKVGAARDATVSVLETVAARSSVSIHEKMATGVGHRSFGASEGRSFGKDAPCRLAFDAIELSPLLASSKPPSKNAELEIWQLEDHSAAAISSPPQNSDTSSDADVMLSPLPCKSPEVCTRESGLMNWEMQEDNVAQEWFRSREMACFESFSKGSKTPEAQPSKSPELSKRAMGASAGVGGLLEATGMDHQQEVTIPNQNTPSPQPTSSPEFLKRGSVPPSAGGCFGAGPLMGPEGMRSVKDRRKCKPRGILTIEGEFLFSSGSADFLDEELPVKETISVPALASVEWMVAEGYDVDPPASGENHDVDASLKVSPGSFSQVSSLGARESTAMPGHRRCRSAIESGTEQVFWKKGLLYEWNLSLSDQKRAESPSSPVAEDEEDETTVSPVGKLRDFSPEITPLNHRLSNMMGSSLVMGALGSVTNTPSSCRDASDYSGEEEVESKFNSELDTKLLHKKEVDFGIEKAIEELTLDAQAPSLSMSFSLNSPPDSGESWQGTVPSESATWSNGSRGDWGDYLRNNRYQVFNSQFRFQASKEEEQHTRSSSRDTLSPTTLSDGYSDGDSVVCTPNSTVTTNLDVPPYRDSWKKYCKTTKPEETPERISTPVDSFSRDTSPDLVGISISISDAPSLDSSSDDFDVLRYPRYTQSMSSMHQSTERDEETKVMPRGRVLLHEADYSPSSLLKGDAFRGVSVSGVLPRGC